MSKDYPHPSSGDLYTPCNGEFLELLERMYQEHGNWRMVAWKGEIRLKVLRDLRQGKRKAVSLTTVDRLTTGTGVGSVSDFIWFTAKDLVKLGIWEPVLYVEGRERVQGDARWTSLTRFESDYVRGRRLRSRKRKNTRKGR